MTFPVYLQLFGVSVSAHQLLEFGAYFLGFQSYLYLRRRWPSGPALSFEQTMFVVLGAIFGALVGAKVLAWAESFPLYWSHRHDWRILIGGKTIVGALLGGWLGVEAVKRRFAITQYTGDIYVFPVILGMSVGRLGCFLQGLGDQTYGLATRLPWGVDFGDGIRRHPTQLYEIAFLVIVAGVFHWRRRTGRQRGCMFSQFMACYLAYRFLIEFIKPRFVVPWLSLSAIQLAALIGIVYAVRLRRDDCCSVPGRVEVLSPGPKAPPAGESRFIELTSSLCETCLTKIDAKVMQEPNGIFLQKFCPEHGTSKVLIADDVPYWLSSRSVYKPPTAPHRFNSSLRRGCPWDCGICPQHEQHCCLAIVEVTDYCEEACPICYASSSRQGKHRSLDEVKRMLDTVVKNEGTVAVVQLSGGEPTSHPEFFEILDEVRRRPIRHLMINTNGRRIAEDPAFVLRLARYAPGLEVYLQFDSLNPGVLREIRGTDVSSIRRSAVAELERHGISTTLVVVLKKGLNDQEIGQTLDFALGHPCIRGVVFQPVQAAGRLGGFDAATDRLTLTEVRRALLEQHRLFAPMDLVPVPCHTDALAMGYAIRTKGGAVPLSRLMDPASLLHLGGNTISYEQDSAVRQHLDKLFSAGASPSSAASTLDALCCGGVNKEATKIGSIDYSMVFRVIIMQFMDAYSMDLRSVKRCCVQIADLNDRLVPFDTFNLIHRKAAHA